MKSTSTSPLVLVVEDELLIAASLEIALECRDFRVLGPVATVAEALSLFETSQPDLALIDYRLASTTTEPWWRRCRRCGYPSACLPDTARSSCPTRTRTAWCWKNRSGCIP